MKNQNIERAKELFESHPNVNTFYFTTDGNAFVAETYAQSWAKDLGNNEVKPIHRATLDVIDKIEQVASDKFTVADANTVANLIKSGMAEGEPSLDTGSDLTKAGSTEDESGVDTGAERAELVAQYTELFGKAPAHNIGHEKLKAAVAKKQSAE
ncbi:hypothetical protein [Solitalea koreensis]|uniref:Uncharacterized protein n=1 Tax=Solitalea koreensis TaxID=543615 RepID=A0A521BLX3_9SPHI|nr:hypothetical protein [Solitalea koreensis]SMO48085.1 hypothetical protein SAMN06265350_102323 [Solitalea koreensis]